eukprot:gene37768-46600_t
MIDTYQDTMNGAKFMEEQSYRSVSSMCEGDIGNENQEGDCDEDEQEGRLSHTHQWQQLASSKVDRWLDQNASSSFAHCSASWADSSKHRDKRLRLDGNEVLL